jgi:hypothetical protein
MLGGGILGFCLGCFLAKWSSDYSKENGTYTEWEGFKIWFQLLFWCTFFGLFMGNIIGNVIVCLFEGCKHSLHP